MAFYTAGNAPKGNAPLPQSKVASKKALLPRGTAKPPSGAMVKVSAPKIDKPKIFRENPGIIKRNSNGKVF